MKIQIFFHEANSFVCLSLYTPCRFPDEQILISNFLIQVTFAEQHISFLHFLTNVCAIVGGTSASSISSYISSAYNNNFVAGLEQSSLIFLIYF